ncbi:MAG: hypothetical protein H0U73_06215 [Tatlockia sp.]|nr:hypothetical protein [Tatlockia sp.]
MISKTENKQVSLPGLKDLIIKYHSVNPPPQALLEIFSPLEDVNIELADIRTPGLYNCPYRISPLTLSLSMCNEPEWQPLIQILLHKGAKTNAFDLYLAFKPETWQVVNPLITHLIERFDASSVNDVLDEQGNTVLHKLAEIKTGVDSETLNFLIQQGADVKIVNNYQKKAIELAYARGKYDFVATLLPFHPEMDSELLKSIYKDFGIYYEKSRQVLSNNLLKNDYEVQTFEKSVEDFLKQNDLSEISDIFNIEKYPKGHGFIPQNYLKLLLDSFYSNKGIIEHMTRDTILFNENLSPKYHPIEEEFYLAAREYKIDMRKESHYIPCRTQMKQGFSIQPEDSYINPYAFFYSEGSHIKTNKIYLDMIREAIPVLSDSCIRTIYPRDVYVMGDAINKYANSSLKGNDRGFLYIISATTKDAHIFATLSVVNTSMKKIHLHLVINSWVNEDYFQMMASKINYNKKPSPVFDASLSIQTEKSDGNCSLYTVRICKALNDIISNNNELQIQLENLDTESMESWENVRHYFHKCLQEKLPEFYRYNEEKTDYEPRPYEELVNFHLQMRWDAGNRCVMAKHQKSHVRIEENYQAWEKISSLSIQNK